MKIDEPLSLQDIKKTATVSIFDYSVILITELVLEAAYTRDTGREAEYTLDGMPVHHHSFANLNIPRGSLE